MKHFSAVLAGLFMSALAFGQSASLPGTLHAGIETGFYDSNVLTNITPLNANPNQPAINNSISDTIDILHYTVKLNITDLTTDTIRGGTIIKLTARVNNVITLPVDLLHMTIDSII